MIRTRYIVGALLPLAALIWLALTPGPRPAAEQVEAGERILRARIADLRERARSAANAMAATALSSDRAGFVRARAIRERTGADGVALLDAQGRASVWAGRTFEIDAGRELYDVRKVGSVEGTLDHPAHPVLYVAVHTPSTDTVAIAFAAFDERLPVRKDLAAEVAREAGLASVELDYKGSGPAAGVRPTAVIEALVHATFFTRTEEESRIIALEERDRRARLLLPAALAWLIWVALARLAGTRWLAPALLLSFGVMRGLLSWLRIPDHDPTQVLLTGLAALAAAAIVRATPMRKRRAGGVALLLFCLWGTERWYRLVSRIGIEGIDYGLFDPTAALPGWNAAQLLAAAAATTLSLLLVAGTALRLLLPPRRRTRAIGPVERSALLALATAALMLPVLHTAHRDAVENGLATHAKALIRPETDLAARDRLQRAVDAATDPDHGVSSWVAAQLVEDADATRLAFEIWASSNWDPRDPCAVEIYDGGLELVSSFDFDAPPRDLLPRGPQSFDDPLSQRLVGQGAGAKIHYRVQDVHLHTLDGNGQPVGIARFCLPDRWDLLRSRLRAPIFSDRVAALGGGDVQPLVVAELDEAGAVRFVSQGARSDLPAPDEAMLARARESGRAAIAFDYQGRGARMLIVPGAERFAAIVYRDSLREQLPFEAAHMLFVLAIGWLVWLLARWRRRAWAFRHTIALFLVLLSVLPVFVIGVFQTDRIEERAEENIRKELRGRLDLAEALLTKRAADVNDAWCVAVSIDHRIDVNIYEGRELLATSRPGVWNTGLLSRQLAAPAYEQLILAGRREYIGREPFAGAGDLRAGYRRLAGDRILVAPELTDRSAVDRGAAEETARLFAFYVLTAALAVMLALPVSYLLLRPVRRLQAATREVAAGNLDVELPPARGRGELGDLERSFASMTRDLRDAQELRVRTERLAAWREMAQQIAHDVKNPLTPMKLTVQNLLALYDEDRELFEEEFGRGANVILGEIDRLQRIAGNFSAYARVPQRQLEQVDLAALLAEVAELHGAAGAIEVQLHGDPLTVRADRDELHRVLNNLITNARQADARRIVLEARRNNADVTVRVIDDGRGIAAETMERIFEPRFTTRTSGAGLGLPIVQGIVNDMGGTIALESDPGEGTRVTMHLPVGE